MTEEITIGKIEHHVKETWSANEFTFQFEPVPDTLTVKKTNTGYKAKYLTIDNNPQNPRTEFDNLGTMICFHTRYNLGDKHSYHGSHFCNQDELEEHIKEDYGEIAVILPVYLYDHSGLRISVTPFNDFWDSGKVGVIFVTKKKVIEEFGDLSDETHKKVKESLIGEIEAYDQYLSGDIYGAIVEFYDENKEQTGADSCFGYFGYDYSVKALKEEW